MWYARIFKGRWVLRVGPVAHRGTMEAWCRQYAAEPLHQLIEEAKKDEKYCSLTEVGSPTRMDGPTNFSLFKV